MMIHKADEWPCIMRHTSKDWVRRLEREKGNMKSKRVLGILCAGVLTLLVIANPD